MHLQEELCELVLTLALSSHCNEIKLLRSTVILFNLTINECLTILTPFLAYCVRDYIKLGVGFGYDLRANDYKIIRFGLERFLCGCREYFKASAEIYSIRNDAWREIGIDILIC